MVGFVYSAAANRLEANPHRSSTDLNQFEMVTFDQLPIELYQVIFGYLDLVEVSTCRLVSKKLNEIVKVFRVRELSFYDSDWNRRSFWFYDTNPIYPCNSLSNSKLAILNSTSIDLQYLKRLRLRFDAIVNGGEFHAEVVNKFENLVHLQFDFKNRDSTVDGWSGGRTEKLKLNSLKHIYIYFESPVFIEFDTPKLESVGFEYAPLEDAEVDQPTSTIRFVAPSTVKELYTFDLLQDELPKIFTGLRHFQCDQLLDLDLDDLLKTFPDLGVLDFVGENATIDDCNALARIMQEKDRLRPSLKIRFESIPLSSSKAIESYAFDKESQLSLLIKHRQSMLSDTCSLQELDYAELMSLTKNGYPIGFLELRPFNSVCIVSVNGVIDDPNRLLNFLLNCVNLEHLQLNNCSLTMEFFDKLPEFTSLLQLEINAGNRDLQLDFSRFLPRITNLVWFETDQNLDAGLLRDVMQKLKFVGYLQFKANGQLFSIRKSRTGEYDLRNFSEEIGWNLIKEVACKNLIEQLIELVDEPTDGSPMDL